jgi:hypothetical protein
VAGIHPSGLLLTLFHLLTLLPLVLVTEWRETWLLLWPLDSGGSRRLQ